MTVKDVELVNGITKREAEVSLEVISDQLTRIDQLLTEIDKETKEFFLHLETE